MKVYKQPRTALFLVECPSNKYVLPGGWVRIAKKDTVLGEDDISYITDLKRGVGYHKSRLIQWCDGQLVIDL